MFENDSFKSARMDDNPLDYIPKSKGGIRLLAASRKLSDPNYRPEQSKLFIGNQLQTDKIFKGGLNGDSLPENVPEHNAADYEKILAGRNNAAIIIGRDRPSSKSSGYGNLGATGAGSIYLKTGMAFPPKSKGKEQIYADNNFKTDSAGIYISQLTDIDNNYELARGSLSLRGRSGIGVKADGVRIIARENIKLVTGPFVKEQNTLGGKNITYYGVDIIAGNDDTELQPMILGNNVVDCISELISIVTNLSAMMDQMIIAQDAFEKSLASHEHPLSVTADGVPLKIQQDPVIKTAKATKAARMTEKVNTKLLDWRSDIADFRSRYLFDKGEKSIKSRHNRVN